MARAFLFTVLFASLLAGCGTPRTQQPLGVSEEKVQELKTQTPLVKSKLSGATFDNARICLDCGPFGDYYKHYLDKRFNKEFPALLQKKLSESGIFDAGSSRSISVAAKLVKFGAGENDRRTMTSRQLSVHYEFMDGNSVVGVRDITSVGNSNSFEGNERYAEAVDDAITRNIRLLVLSLIASSNSSESERAKSEMAALDAQARQNLSGNLVGVVLFGAIDSVKAVGSAAGGAITFLGKNSGAISAGLNSTSAQMDRSNREYNQAYGQALLASRQPTASTSTSGSGRNESTSSSSSSSGTTRSATAVSTPQNASSSSATSTGTRVAGNTRTTASNDNALKEAEALKAQQDREKKRLQEEQRAKEASDRAREQELSRQRQIKEKADRLAAEQAQKAAEQQAQKAYLATLVQGIRLVATKCPDGAGHYYATGTMPKVKNEGVSCIDVHYEASCPGSRQTVSGVAKNFVGMSGCFGDTYQVEPKPACEVKEVRIRVTDVRPGCS